VFNIGPQELLLILLVALVIVGPKRLPELSRTIGRGLREFRKAQDEVTKTIRLGLDETEPTAKPAGRRTETTGAAEGADASATAEGPPAAADEPALAPEPDEAADIARTLGRGLAEVRRARQEIQRTFRVDLWDRPTPPARRPAPGPSTTAAPAPTSAPSAGSAPSAEEAPAEPPAPEAGAPATGSEDSAQPGTDG
jgi:TatA/E family protein of Tat protein translocase